MIRPSYFHLPLRLISQLLLHYFTDGSTSTGDSAGISDQRIISLDECRQMFANSLQDLSLLKDNTADKTLVWDKVSSKAFSVNEVCGLIP